MQSENTQPENIQSNSLPDNAYRELRPGEEYHPVMPAASRPKEVTLYSVLFGIVMAIVFSAAAAYLGLRVGQVFEAAIPIAIIAVGVGNLTGRKNMLGQNVIIQSIGATSGVIVAGAIFTLPALYILGLEAQFYQIFLSSLFGGLLGIVLLIPFRKYFVKDMQGRYPFPEATATTEVLVSGEKKGNQAKLLAVSGLIGGLVRLRRQYVRLVDRRDFDEDHAVGHGAGRQNQTGVQGQYRRGGAGARLHRGAEIRRDHLRRIVHRMVRADSLYQPFCRRADHRCGRRCDDLAAGYEPGRDLP